MALSSKQRAHLRSLAHHLKPVVNVGKEGITEAVVSSVENAFNRRELLKIKFLEYSPVNASEGGIQIAGKIDRSVIVQIIGRIAVLYRPYEENPVILLP